MRRIVSFLAFLWMCSCANQTSPTGGPSDKTPPELLSSSPRDNEKNFTGSTIQLLFNEDVKLKNPKEEILITPSIGKKSKFIAKGRRVVIEPELPWVPNTTYSISLREGVQDITEGNAAENVRIAFSTGPTIDSLQLSGTINYTFNEKKAESVTVAIYESDTFDIFNHAPTYFTFTDKQGKYLLKNLKASDFFVYAFDDKNKNLKIESKGEAFSFLGKKILTTDTSKVNLSLIKVDARPIKITAVRHSNKISTIRFSKEVDSIEVTDKNKLDFLRYGSSKNELLVYHALLEGDSIPFKVLAKDSTQQRVDSIVYIKSVNQKIINEQFKIQTIQAKQDFFAKTFIGTFKINKLVKSTNLDSILIKIDTTKTYAIESSAITYDTLNNLLEIKTPLSDTIALTSKPSIYFGKGALITIEQDSSKRTTSAIKYGQPNQTGSISIEVKTKEPSYIIQILKDDKIERELNGRVKTFNYQYSEPGNYKIRVIIDTNQNGRWDPGNFYSKIEPEKVIYYKNTEGQTTIPTRANWEVGPLVITF